MQISHPKKIIDSIGSGFMILDENLKIHMWNRWLEIHTSKHFEDVWGKGLNELFDELKTSSLKRKIKTALVMDSPVFYNSDSTDPLFEISRPNITQSIFSSMKQNITITPYDNKNGLVCINIVDNTLLHEANYKLKTNISVLETLSVTDDLTNIFNKNKFNERIAYEMKISQRHNSKLSLIIFDIDDFKEVNDTYGHNTGDKILKIIADIVSENIRDTDTFSRWGGEEFTILMPGSSIPNAIILAEGLRSLIEKINHEDIKSVTCSFGISSFISSETQDMFFNRADEALYRAKESGKNRVNFQLDIQGTLEVNG